MAFFENLERICKKRGISVDRAAKAIGKAGSTASAWRRGATPYPSTIKALADYLEVSIDELTSEFEPQSETHPHVYRVPVLGRVAAGLPLYVAEEIVDWEELPLEWKKKGEFFGLQIKGDSMAPRICEGDVVIVKKQEQVENGDIAIVLVNGDSATCKKVLFNEKGITLISLNATHAPQFYTCDEVKSLPVTILGKVVELRGKF